MPCGQLARVCAAGRCRRRVRGCAGGWDALPAPRLLSPSAPAPWPRAQPVHGQRVAYYDRIRHALPQQRRGAAASGRLPPLLSLRACGGWYHFRAKDAAGGLFTRLRKVKGWKTRFFFLTSPKPWQIPACWGGPPTKSSKSDPLLTDKEKTLAEKLLGTNFSAQLPAQPPPAVRIGGKSRTQGSLLLLGPIKRG